MRRNVFRLLLISGLLFLFGDVYSQEWIPLGNDARGKAVTMEVVQDDASSYQVEITINGLYDQTLTNEHGSFHRLSFDRGGSLLVPGDPDLPFLSQLIAIPSGTRLSPSIRNEVWEDIDMATICPAQRLLRDGERPTEFVINKQSYHQTFLPPLISIGEQMKWRGIDNVGLAICPFKYYPQNGKLSVLKHFVLQLDFLPDDDNLSKKQFQYENKGHLGLFDNSAFTTENDVSNLRSLNNELLLIIPQNSPILQSHELKEFRRWKALKGIKTKIDTLTSAWNNPNAIKNHISLAYNNGIRYILFVGNENTIPLYSFPCLVDSRKTIYSDYWYGCINDSTLETVPIGRFPTNQIPEFANMVNKTIRYEMGQNLSNKVLLMAHMDGAEYNISGTYQGCSNTILGQNSGNATFYTAYGADSIYGGNNATNSGVVNLINQGMHLVNYRGHGAIDFWGGFNNSVDSIWNAAGETFLSSGVDSMSNNANAVFFSVSCNTGNITGNANMLKEFMRSPKGASAFIGSTSSSYTFPNNEYDINLFQKLYTQDSCRLGDVNMNAQVYTIQTYSPDNQYNTNKVIDNAFSYICGGDPTLEIWTGDPLPPISDVYISSTGNSVTVNTGLVNGYYICVADTNGVLVDKSWVSGHSYTFTKPDNIFYFSIIKQGHIPFVVYCDSETDALSDVEITDNRYYDNTPFAAGEGVGTEIGDVILEEGSALFIQKGSGGVLLDEGFKCNKGARLIIK